MMHKQAIAWMLGAWMACGADAAAPQSKPTPAETVYTGMCDASAAVAVGTNLFLVANDEDNRLRLYRRDTGGPPLQSPDLSRFLAVDPKSPESDLEAAAVLGDQVYWITSHGRNRLGRERESRHRLFAVRIQVETNGVALVPVGRPYANLVRDLLRAPPLQRFALAEAAQLAPKETGGLNIEGLCATPERTLLLGFRSPLAGRRALLVPLLNPEAVLTGVPARLGDPILLDLGGLGIRDMVWAVNQYFVVGGAAGDGGKPALFRWSGGPQAPVRVASVTFKQFTPEALVIYPDLGLRAVQILSDDGTRKVNGVPCKELKWPEQRRFRARWFNLQTVDGSGEDS